MATFPAATEYERSTGYEVSFRSLEAQFGDGYRQRGVDGINPERQTWRITTLPLDETDFGTVRDFLRDNAGLFFDWTPPLETATIPVTCNGYNVRFLGGSVYKRIAAEFSGQITG